ncbi:Sec34-domain-containing protein [Lepidopterella palustris CBS 459.81]|uniref:Conserved oligomeric Golgi complex subunit 3 n=1 Tax=Lepidopterella palustris CBS 459.81 TaxID=1314670 RepID=A0A8E2JGB6_9PEZI|nr:Sec34-domain-containing protein [Lepidopterella palustris CBS 459.81]
MYEDSWYNAFVPRSHSKPEKSKHRRRESLLKQPNGSHADVERVEGITEIIEDAGKTNEPPKATVARRAKSYSDFYDVVRAHMRKERGLEREKRRSRENIRTELEFAEWYAGVSEELLVASHEEYQLYRDQLHLTRTHLDSLVSDTTSTLHILSSLTESFKAVETQTTAFREQCEDLMTDQKRITKLADDIEHNLRYYLYLEPITKRLNAPGAGNFVRGKEFTEMLFNLDNCIDYMQAHPNHRESATYRSRYRLLLTRALTLIRVHFTNALREIAADVAKRIADRQLNDTTMSALLYAKFRVGAPELKRIGLEIQKRAVLPAGADAGSEAEYQSLMNELYQSYSTTRGRLILPIVTKKIGEIAQAPSSSKDLVAFARSSISYLRGICFDEYDLWGEWFDGEGGLYDFLEAICEPLYDHLRPRTIHETQILKLCELCTLIQTRYMEEEEEDAEPVDTNRLDFTALIHPALEDAQTRLVFLALAVLRDEIERYKPKPEDLDYPARNQRFSASGTKNIQPVLSGRKASSNAPQTPMPKTPMVVEEEDRGDGDARWNFNADAVFKDWYPTLRKAIWLLSKIYRLVHSSVFDDLAHRIVHSTTSSLVSASALISTRVSPTDGTLFLLKHLLLLKQQIVAFDIEFVTPETDLSFDFASLTAQFWELRSRGGLFNAGNLVRLAAGGLVPRVVENMLDAKAELDARLRVCINDFTGGFAKRMAAAVAEKKKGKGGVVTPADAAKATKMVRESVEREVPFLRGKLDAYIDDTRTKEMLVAAVMEQVVSLYEEWWEEVLGLGPEASSGGGGWGGANGRSGKGKGREDDVWDPDAFAEWSAGVFKVGRLGLGIMSEEPEEMEGGGGSGSESERSGTGYGRSGST